MKLVNFISTIKSAAQQAGKRIMDEHYGMLGTYFHSSSKGTKRGSEDDGPQEFGDLEHLTPRMVVMKFPRETAEGPGEHNVAVPLIALAPFHPIKLSSMTVEMDVELSEEDGELAVAFPARKARTPRRGKATTPGANAKIKMFLKTGDATMGVKTIIEAYDKALKAQVPN